MIRLFILLVLSIKSAWGSFQPIEGVTPLELSHIVMELQSHELFKADSKRVNELILKTDRSLGRLEKSDAMFFIRAEIYKTLLGRPPHQTDGLVSLSASLSLKELGLFAAKIDKISSPFLVWMAKAVYRDLKGLMESPLFHDYRAKIKKPDQWNKRLEKMKKKFLLVLPWYYYLKENRFVQERDKLFPILLECLRAVYEKSLQYSFLTNQKGISSQGLSYFREYRPEEKKQEVAKNDLDSLLDPVVDKHQKPEEIPVVVVDDWTPSSHLGKTSLPRPIDDWVLPDKNLPRPTDDWPLPKKNLPRPTDDWILLEEL